MESQPALFHTPGSNACSETEFSPSGQHRKGNLSPETKTRLEEKQCNEAKEHEKCTSRESVKTLKHTALASNADLLPASKIPTMHSTTTKQITNANKMGSKQPAKMSTLGVEVLSSSSGISKCETREEATSKTVSQKHPKGSVGIPHHGLRRIPTKDAPKSASASQISCTDSPKSLNRLSLSHIPKASSSPKIKASSPASLKVDKTERIKKMPSKEIPSPKDEMIDTERKPGAKTAIWDSPLGQHEIKSGDISSLLLHRESNPEQPKSPEDKIDAYVTTQERKTGKSLWEQKEREETESKECKMKNDNMVNNIACKSATFENKKDSETMTQFSTIATKDAAIQTDVIYIDAEIQAVVKLCCKSTDMSPLRNIKTLNLNSDTNPEVNLRNDLNPDSNSDSDCLSNGGLMDSTPIGAKPRFLGPLPYKSPNTQKPHQHVCQIEIELRSESPQTFGWNPPDLTISNSTYRAEKTLKDSIKCLGKTGEVDRQKDESAAPQQIVWDEQGMTWEVYGAALDMESLGFAIQSHLQCKIREHERRIGTLRKSICLSEQSPGKERMGKRKRNVFRSLFAGSHCCSKTSPEEGMAK